MDFKTFFFGLTIDERDQFAASTGTSRALLTQVAYGNKSVELGFADVLVAKGRGAFSHDDLPLTERASSQRQMRQPANRVDLETPANTAADATKNVATQGV